MLQFHSEITQNDNNGRSSAIEQWSLQFQILQVCVCFFFIKLLSRNMIFWNDEISELFSHLKIYASL